MLGRHERLTSALFRPEGKTFLCGASPSCGPDLDNLPLDEVDYALFEDRIWPALAHCAPQFEALRIQNTWSGYDEYNVLDQNAIIGYHPDIDNGGLQQGPATGRGVAELILHGGFVTLDLSALGFERVLRGQPLVERNVV